MTAYRLRVKKIIKRSSKYYGNKSQQIKYLYHKFLRRFVPPEKSFSGILSSFHQIIASFMKKSSAKCAKGWSEAERKNLVRCSCPVVLLKFCKNTWMYFYKLSTFFSYIQYFLCLQLKVDILLSTQIYLFRVFLYTHGLYYISNDQGSL